MTCLYIDIFDVRFLFIVFVDNDDEWNPWGQEFENEAGEQPRYDPPDIQWDMKKLQGSRGEKSPNSSTSVIVEVWSKAAIGKFKANYYARSKNSVALRSRVN